MGTTRLARHWPLIAYNVQLKPELCPHSGNIGRIEPYFHLAGPQQPIAPLRAVLWVQAAYIAFYGVLMP